MSAPGAGEAPGPMMLKERAAGLGAPDLHQHLPAQHTESINIPPSSLTVAKKFKIFKISGSAMQVCKWHFQKRVVIYIAP